MEIKPATPENYVEIAKLITHELGYKDLKYEDIHNRLEAIRNDTRHLTLVACIDNTVVGFIGLSRAITYEMDEFIWILAFVVSNNFQHQGIGGALLDKSV